MADAKREDVQRDQRTCRVATVGAGGQPHATAMWFVWDGSSIWLNSLSRTQRWTDLLRDPRLSVLVDGGEEFLELYGIEVIGRATVVGEVPRTGEPVDELREPERLFSDGDRFPEVREAIAAARPAAFEGPRAERDASDAVATAALLGYQLLGYAWGQPYLYLTEGEFIAALVETTEQPPPGSRGKPAVPSPSANGDATHQTRTGEER